ncbi:hypothetical protein [Haladaptatus caseinilyticus]|uniref:hypothetical protein n=1 Tax=Haladaptatus caseinilyticus TaxID=2993314 RepID=UPI00224AAB4A|nr:hypothetical protein [Haladaptatus caseinilyticus]
MGVAPYHEKARLLYLDRGFEFTDSYEGTQAPPEIHADWDFHGTLVGRLTRLRIGDTGTDLYGQPVFLYRI